MSNASEARTSPRQHLLRLLLEQFERTFTTEGHPAAFRAVADLLGRLDDDALRAYAYDHGIRSEEELEAEADGDRV